MLVSLYDFVFTPYLKVSLSFAAMRGKQVYAATAVQAAIAADEKKAEKT